MYTNMFISFCINTCNLLLKDIFQEEIHDILQHTYVFISSEEGRLDTQLRNSNNQSKTIIPTALGCLYIMSHIVV